MQHREAWLPAHAPLLHHANQHAEAPRVRASEQGTESQMASASRKSIENGRPPCRHPWQILLSKGVKTSELVRRNNGVQPAIRESSLYRVWKLELNAGQGEESAGLFHLARDQQLLLTKEFLEG